MTTPNEDAPAAVEQDWSKTIENLHSRAQEVFPTPFQGAKLLINKGLSSNFQVNHSINLSDGDQSGYRFGATFIGHNKVSDSEPYPILLGEIQPNGNLQAQIIHYLDHSARIRYFAQVQQSQMVSQRIATDFRTKRWQTSLTLINPEIESKRFMSAVDIMRQVTPNLALGTMFFCQVAPQVPSGKEGIWSFGGRYTSGQMWAAALSLRPFHMSFQSSFHMKVNEQLQLAADLESNMQQQTNVATLGYQYDMAKTSVCIKAQMDSNFNVAATLEKKLLPFPFSFLLSASGSPLKSRYEIGVSLTVG